MMLNAMAPQLHHQQTGAGEPIAMKANSSSASSSSVATTNSTSPSSSSSASSTTTTNHHHHNNHQQQQSHSHLNELDSRESQATQITDVTNNTNSVAYATTLSSTTTTTITATTTTTTISATSTTTTSSVSSSSNEVTTNNKSPATQTVTSHSAHHQHQHQNHYHNHHHHHSSNNNSYQSPRYNNQHSHHDSHHNYNMSYANRSSNNNQRGHNSNHNHNNHHSHHNHNTSNNNNHHNHQNHHHHHHHHQQQQQQPVDEASRVVNSSASLLQTSDTTTTTVSNSAQRQQSTGPPHYVDLHVNAGECVSLQLLDGQEQVVAGPATITMISQQQNPPVPIPVQVPPGHMIHQIADENGTLKHIILSVMNGEGGSQLDSTVINLPKGTFRIDSHGQLVSTSDSDGGILTTLPQQAYFANYDGCPVAYGATTLPDSIESTTPVATLGQTLVSDTNYPDSQTHATIDAAAITNDKNEQEQCSDINSVSVYDKNTTVATTNTIHQETENQQSANQSKENDMNKHNVSFTGQDANKHIANANRADSEFSSSDKMKTDGVVIVAGSGMPTSSEVDQQMVIPGSINEPPYPAHQALGSELDLLNGTMGPILPPVDGQLYGYPPCCCCCYCDPQETAARQQQPLTSQQELIIAPEQPTGLHGTTGGRMANRSSAGNLSHANGTMAYQNTLMAPIPGNMSLPLAIPPPPAGPMLGPTLTPIPCQNGVTPPSSLVADSTSSKIHGHKGSRGPNSGYKQHKIMSSNASSSQSGDRQSYTGQYNHQSYNNIVSGHHHHHQQHYQQSAELGTSPSSYKSQALLPNQGSMIAGNYSPVYSGFDPVPSTMSSAVPPYTKTSRGNQNNHHHNSHGHHHHNNHQPQGSNSRNSDSDNFMQRNREQVSYNHTTSYGTTTGVRQSNNESSKRQILSDKTSEQQQHSNRYTMANIKVIGNNHSINNQQLGTGNNPTQTGSVSPIRSRLKGNTSVHQHNSHNHHNFHQPNSLRNHYNAQSNAMQPHLHEVKENNMLSMHPNSSYHSSTTRDSSSLKSSRNNIHSQDHISSVSRHINSVTTTGHHLLHSNTTHNKQQGLAWQHNKFNSSKSSPATSTPIAASGNKSEPSRERSTGGSTSINQVQSNDSSFNNKANDPSVENEKEHSTMLHDPGQQSVTSGKIEPKNEDFNSRVSRGKQKKCQNQSRNQPPSDCHYSNNKHPETSNKPTNNKPLDETVSEYESGKISTATDKSIATGSPAESRSDSKSSQARETVASSVKQQGKSVGSKRVRDKSLSHSGKITSDKGENLNSKSSDSKSTNDSVAKPGATCKSANLPQSEISTNQQQQQTDNKQSEIETSNDTTNSRIVTVKTTACSNLANESFVQTVDSDQVKHKSKHNINQMSESQMKNGSPARSNSKKSTGGAKGSQTSNSQVSKTSKSATESGGLAIHQSPNDELDARINEELENDMLLEVSKPDDLSNESQTSCTKSSYQTPAITISMRTSLSENNIRSLELTNSSCSMKSTQTTPQKPAPSSLDGDVCNGGSVKDGTAGETTSRKKATDSKRRGSNAKSEQVKLSSMPQLRLLNLNCTSVASNYVQLRWSYVPSLAEKYGIHQHHHSGFKNPALMDHFVIECSNCKSPDTTTLVSPKIVYQGCAMTCRVNQLSSEKIYHFKVRRTALLTTTLNEAESGGNSEHLVVSDILSVTLPSVQQHLNLSHAGKKSATGKSNKSNSIDTSSGAANGISGEATVATTSCGLSGPNRGYTSSHSNSSSSKVPQQQVRFSSVMKHCRTKFISVFGKLVQKSLSTYSDTKFAGLLLTLFTVFAMLLAIFIHYYIVTPVTE